MATKTTRRKLESIYPPREVKDNTKERRAWLQAKLAEVLAQGNREAKIVDKGSYENIAVWEVVNQEGRTRYRGHCQFCGHLQVVKSLVNGAMALHGYQRPGWGQVYGRCPGTGLMALNVENFDTNKWYVDANVRLEKAKADALVADAEFLLAQDTFARSGEAPESYRELPRFPAVAKRYLSDVESERRQQLRNEWAKRYPLTHAYEVAKEKHNMAHNAVRMIKGEVEHFNMLITGGYYGKPLQEEVV
jgi:hypothetical protein